MSQVTVHPEARVLTLKCTHTDCNGTAKVPVSLAAKAAVEACKTDEREVTATCGHTNSK